MKTIFQETFDSSTDGLPGGWKVEYNSDLHEVPAIRRADQCIELLSAGNKYLPIIPPLPDFELEAQFSFSLTAGGSFGLILSFRYDEITGRGQAFRIRRDDANSQTRFEYGSMRANQFTATESRYVEIPVERMDRPFLLSVKVSGTVLEVSAFGEKAEFKIEKGTGSVALSREHFFDILKLQSLLIRSDKAAEGKAAGDFTISLPQEPTFYPIYCDVKLTDFGSCMDADLTFHGGVPETETGEGNYHVMRTDHLTKPYLKVIEEDSVQKNIIYDQTIILVPPDIAPKYFFERLYQQTPWPFTRKVRFAKPAGKFDLAIGCEDYLHSTLLNLRQTPSETIFDLSGNVLYSGQGITENQYKVEIRSQADKEMLRKLPESDPRYEKAVEFVKKNHYFFEGEEACFTILLTTGGKLPLTYECHLLDALLRPVKKLKCKVKFTSIRVGQSLYQQAELIPEKMKGLQCGVYHIHFKSSDPSVPEAEDYAAFEFMSRSQDALPPPLISGLPFLYNSRTETRGLLGDGFDPWTGSSVDEGHYIACSNFLPAAARKFDVIPTVHAYGRKHFLWLGTRCQNKTLPEDNLDLLSKTDYVNITQHLNQFSLLWRTAYGGRRLELFYKLARELNDPDFDYEAMEKQIAAWKKDPGVVPEMVKYVFKYPLDAHNFKVMASKYWEQWVDAANADLAEQFAKHYRQFHKINPKLKFSQYGPAHIYAARLKGPEFTRTLANDLLDPALLGFWQFEDYPFACSYGLDNGVYFLTSHIMTHPGAKVYPEIYTHGSIQGCPDGAVFYAHPPMGVIKGNYPNRMIRQVYEFAFASAHRTADGFHFWEQRGFQACKFSREWFEALLKAWRTVQDHAPAKPLRTPAFVSSNRSRRAHKTMVVPFGSGAIIDVRNTAAEVVPFIYEQWRRHHQCSGFQVEEENLLRLTEADVSALVLPPLKGMRQEVIDHIRKLHEKGVGLLACEDVSGLEDLFGVRDTGKERTVTKISSVGDFCKGASDTCDDERCTGRYEAEEALILLEAEIPVLTIKHNKTASAAFFNVPPQIVKIDRLHQRLNYSKSSISPLINDAASEVLKMVSNPEITLDCGRLIGYEASGGEQVIILCNPNDGESCSPVVTLKKAPGRTKLISCDHPCSKMKSSKGMLSYRVSLPPGDGAVLIFR